MNVQELFEWWNLIYALPLLISIVWILATAFAGADLGGHDHGLGELLHHAIGHDGHDVGHDIGHDAGHGGHDTDHGSAHAPSGILQETGVAHSSHADMHGAHSMSFSDRLIWVFGLDQAPLTLIIGAFLLCWGAFGLMLNRTFDRIAEFPAVYIWPSMGLTFLLSFAITRSMAAVMGRYLPSSETYGESRYQMVGSLAKVVYTVGNASGTVDIKDSHGTIHRVQARTEESAEPIPSGSEVVVIDFDDSDRAFVVRKSML